MCTRTGRGDGGVAEMGCMSNYDGLGAMYMHRAEGRGEEVMAKMGWTHTHGA